MADSWLGLDAVLRIAFDRATAGFGDPAPPELPPVDLLAPALDAALPGLDDVRTPRRRGVTPEAIG